MKRKKSHRRYDTRRIRQHLSYSLLDIAELFSLHKNAVRNWLREGLPTIDRQKPYLVHGSELKAFLERRQARRKAKCQPDEFYCLRCRAPRQAWGGLVDALQLSAIRYNLTALCSVCEGSLYRLISTRQLPEVQERLRLQQQRQENI